MNAAQALGLAETDILGADEPETAPSSENPMDAAQQTVDFEPTDAGNARRLALAARHDLIAITGQGSALWNGTHWAPDDVEGTGAMRWALHTAEAIRHEAEVLRADGANDATVKARYSHYLRSQSRPRLEAALRLARVELQVAPDRLDADPYLLNCPNGTVDLRTGVLREHDRRDLITRTTGVAYLPGEVAGTWDAFLAEVLPGIDLRIYAQTMAGYLATGLTDAQVFFVLLGAGANGKSVAVRALKATLGDYATTAAAETFMVSRRGGGDTRSDLVRLRGVRLVTTSETSDGLRFDDRLLKETTGGETITARALYSHEVTFTPAFKLVVSCNALPRFDGADYAMRRRLRVLPFSVQIPADRQDPALAHRLADEAPGILAWIVAGARQWFAHGLGTCPEVEAASTLSADDMDPVGLFLEERCDLHPSAFTPSVEIAAAYGEWAQANRQPDLGAKKLGDALGRHGLRSQRTKAARGWSGVRLAPVTDGDGSSRNSTREEQQGTSGRIRHHVSPPLEMGVS